MGWLGDYKPALAMIGLQFAYAGVSLTGRAALLQGMSPMVYVVYRQVIATLVMAPMAYFTRRKTSRCSMGWRSFYLIFLASLFGVTICQATFFEGIFLASSSIGSALFNLTPTVTLVMAYIVGLEKLSLRSLRSVAKIMGTVICAGSAVAIALLRGPKLFNTDFLPRKLVLGSETESWLLGCLLCFGSSCCWSLLLILQVPVCASYPDRLSLSTWMCVMSTLQSAAITLFLERDLGAWKLHSNLELACCIYSGAIGSGLSFVVLAWCISRKGPLFSAMFNPVCTVIVTIFGSIFLHEKVYAGSLLGTAGVIIGLYIVLWGKATDNEELNAEIEPIPQNDQIESVHVLMDDSSKRTSCTINLEETLLSKKSTDLMIV